MSRLKAEAESLPTEHERMRQDDLKNDPSEDATPDEDALDNAIEETFPASDPISP